MADPNNKFSELIPPEWWDKAPACATVDDANRLEIEDDTHRSIMQEFSTALAPYFLIFKERAYL